MLVGGGGEVTKFHHQFLGGITKYQTLQIGGGVVGVSLSDIHIDLIEGITEYCKRILNSM